MSRCCEHRLNPPWAPASLWWIRPSTDSPLRLRIHKAISRASSGSSVGIVAAVRQPTIRRENTSETNAVNRIPDQQGT
jgi:hypothetical protein